MKTIQKIQQAISDTSITIFFLAILMACAGEDKGGDHVGDDKIFTTDSVLPDQATTASIAFDEVSLSHLHAKVYLLPQYRYCMDSSWDEELLAKLQPAFSAETVKIHTKSGWQTVVNHTLQQIKKFSSAKSPTGHQIEMILQNSSSTNCNFYVIPSAADQFPFSESDFEDSNFAIFHPNQIEDREGRTNKMPVIYLHKGFLSTLIEAGNILGAQLPFAAAIGFRSIERDTSPMAKSTQTNSDISSLAEANLEWNLYNSEAKATSSEEWLGLGQFALLYTETLKLKDLESFHYYSDSLNEDAAPMDTQLPAEMTTTEPGAFEPLFGNEFLKGLRLISEGEFNICWHDAEGIATPSEDKNQLISTLSSEGDGSLLGWFNKQHSFSILPVLAEKNCQLLIATRASSDFPFKDRKLNAMYAKEKSVSTTQAEFPIPIIYLNTDAVYFSKVEQGKKSARLSLQHEFGHFMGFRHSTSDTSLMYPAGQNENWEFEGYDGSMIEEYFKQYNKRN